VPADELKARANAKLEDLQARVRLDGFRPGKVPIARVRQLYGRAVMAEVMEEAVGETSSKALEERKERPALRPDIKLPEDQATIQRMIEGASDLEYTMSFEVLPKIELTDLKSITLEKEAAEPAAEDVEKALDRMIEMNVSYDTKEGVATERDRLTIDYQGRIDGEPFEGGAGEDAYVVLGSGRFLPGFEAGLLGAKAGEDREVRLTFPGDYTAKHLAGKEAVFGVKVKDVAAPVQAKRDDEFAKSLGLESLAKLEDAIRQEQQKQLDQASRNKLKKSLLDALDERHSFELPPSLVQTEFDSIWRGAMRQLEQSGGSFESEGTTEEEARAEYLGLAERRVRLGLILSEIGNENQIRISEDELRRAMIDRARLFPGRERMVMDYYTKSRDRLNELRAPVYEEKVINFALELVKIEEKPVTSAALLEFSAEQEREQALLDDGGEDLDHEHDHDHDHHGHHHDHDHGADHEHGPGCNHDHDHHHD
jgi:trigger factor